MPQVSLCLNAGGMGRLDLETETLVAHSLKAEGFDAGEDGTGRGTPIVPDVYPCLRGNQYNNSDPGMEASMLVPVDISPPLMSGSSHEAGHNARSGHGKDNVLIPVACFDPNQVTSKTNRSQPVNGLCHTLPASSLAPVAFARWGVRRLMPIECERLQGFPDNYTAIKFKGKAAADGPRYRALGNSMAVNCMRWLGERLLYGDGLTCKPISNERTT